MISDILISQFLNGLAEDFEALPRLLELLLGELGE